MSVADSAVEANGRAHDSLPGREGARPGGANPASTLPSRPQRPKCNLPAAWFEPDPDAEATSPEAVVEAARRYVEAGLSVIPIAADGSKGPDWPRLPQVWDEAEGRYKRSWKPFQ